MHQPMHPRTRDTMPRKRMTKANAHEFPAGITHDLLHQIRKALRTLRRAEKLILQKHRAEKRQQKKSTEWSEAQRIRDQDQQHQQH